MHPAPPLTEFTEENLGFYIRVTEQDGREWFVAKDVCDVLDIKNHNDAVTGLEDDERDEVGITDAIGRNQETTVISESGLYALIFRSRKPQAKAFRKWVTSEILPAIRRSGSYNYFQRQSAPPMPVEHPAVQFLQIIDALRLRGASTEKCLYSVGNLFQSSLAGAYQSNRQVLPMALPAPPDPALLPTKGKGRFSPNPESATSIACDAIRSVLEENPPLTWSELQKKSAVDAVTFRNAMRRFRTSGEVIQRDGLWSLS